MTTQSTTKQKRFRDYNFSVGFLTPGRKNLITDVSPVTVGHFSKIVTPDICTGITVIDPGIGNLYRNKLPAAIAIGNGYGKLTGISQVEELGTLEAPIALTNTLAVGSVMRGIVDFVIHQTKDLQPTESINVVVGETNDGFLNDLHADALTKQDVLGAIKNCTIVPQLGSVGAGTGTRAFSWKGGIGSASRTGVINGVPYTLGALVQTNYGGALTINGVPVGKLLGKTDFGALSKKTGDGSCMIVIATDAPVTSRQLKRIAARAFLALGKTGSILSHGSGDYAIAFSTNRAGIEGVGGKQLLKDEELNLLFVATIEAVEESVYDALFLATPTVGRAGNKLEALPIDTVVKLLTQYDASKN